MIADASEALAVEDAAGELVEKLTRPRPRLMAFTAVMGLVALLLPLCWIYQIREGIGVAGINRPVFWGLYIINFVFWIGISH
ncbi:MAG: hydrogenase, partial [Acidobacteriota bacterium]